MENNIGWLLSRAAFAWRHAVDLHMAELGLTQSRWIAMLHLDRTGEGCSQKELATDIGIEQPSLLRTLNLLEESGLIFRKVSEEDARRKTLWFTEKGRELMDAVEATAFKGRQQMLQGLSEQERDELHTLLNKIVIKGNHFIPENS